MVLFAERGFWETLESLEERLFEILGISLILNLTDVSTHIDAFEENSMSMGMDLLGIAKEF